MPRDVDFSTVHRILVIRQHDMLGDFLLATPVFRSLRMRFPEAHIGALVRDYFEDAILCNPHVDEILVLRKSGNQWNIVNIWRLLRGLLRKWDLTIVLNTVSHSLSSDILATISGAHYVLGSDQPLLHGCFRNFFYNLLAPRSSQTMHQSNRNLETVRYLGAETNDLCEEMRLEDSELTHALKRLNERGVAGEHPVIAMHVGAGKPTNRWPIDRFARLAQQIHEQWKADVILFWGRDEDSLALEFCRLIRFDPIKVPPGSIRELAAFFKHCDLLVCNDTGIMHVCAAVGVPLVAVFGPTDPAEWKPIGDSFAAIRGTDKTVDSVTVEDVYALAKTLIQKIKGKDLASLADSR